MTARALRWGGIVSDMATRTSGGVDVVFEAPRWSERWVLEDGVTMPESDPHRLTCELLEDVLRTWVRRAARDARVFGNIALRWAEEHPRVGVDPDVCLVEPAPPGPEVRSVLTWVEGHRAPTVAAEVVSRDTARKDYQEGPAKYAASGTGELWIFDPDRRGRGVTGEPWVLQVWRRTRSGEFRREYAGDGPAYSESLGAWLVVTDDGTHLWIADDEGGERLWPTEAEAERARAEAERARAEAEKARADALAAQVEALTAQLEALKGR